MIHLGEVLVNTLCGIKGALVLDDVLSTYAHKGKARRALLVDAVQRIIAARHDQGLPTLLTTNLKPSQVAELYGEAGRAG